MANMNYGGQRGYQGGVMQNTSMNMPAMQSQQHAPKPGHVGGNMQQAGSIGGMAPSGNAQHAASSLNLPGGGPSTAALMSPAKEVNLASLAMLGQETIQDIVGKTVELFKHFTSMQLPNNVSQVGNYGDRTAVPISIQNYQERKAKLAEVIPLLQTNFRKVRIIFDRINEQTAALESQPLEKLLPIEENGEIKGERYKNSESMKYALEEYKETCEQLSSKNQQMKEIIDQLRMVIWEINTMMAMRKV